MSSKQMTTSDGTLAQNSTYPGKSALEILATNLEISSNSPLSDHHIVKMIEDVIGKEGKELKYVIDVAKYAIWDKNTLQWSFSDGNEHFEMFQTAYSTLQRMFFSMLDGVEGLEEKKKLLSTPLGVAFGKALGHRRTKLLLECLAAQPGYTIKRGIFDTSNELLPLTTRNGKGVVYDLENDRLREAKKEDYILLKLSIRLKDGGMALLGMLEAKETAWLKGSLLERTLEHLFKGRDDLQRVCQQAFGYSLRGDNPAQKFFAFIGEPGTGKSTLVNAMHKILGTTAATLNSDVITRGGKALTPDDKYQIGRLEGKRMAMVGEPATEAKLSESFIKAITGESCIVMREIYGQPRDVEPKAKIVATTNSVPIILDPSGAMHRRMILLRTYAETITKSEDKVYVKIAENEADEFLAWLIIGHKDWKKNGFVGPDECFGRSASVIKETSDLAGFVTVDKEDTNAWVQLGEEYRDRVYCGDVFQAYVAWVEQTTRRKCVTSPKLFNKKFRQLASAELGKKLEEDSKNGVHWKGVRIVRGM